jgi:RNA polymerase sigma-70 factor (ECF subfamily)
MKTDSQYIQDVLRGDKKSYEQLVLRHEKFLMKVIARMTRDLDAAEDIVQETFIKAYRRLSSFEGRSSFRSWLYQIAVNTARNRFRRSHQESINLDHYDVAVENTMEGQMIWSDVREVLRRQIEQLPERQRQALSLRVFEDLSFQQIAEIMDCPYDTAKANYRHALMKLKEKLGNQPGLRAYTETTFPINWTLNSMEADV